MVNTPMVKSYPALLNRIKATIDSGRRQIEHIKALTYWKIGEHISKHLLNHNGRAGYGDELYQKLSTDLDIHKKTIEKTVQFYRKFPKGNARSQLSWSHYRELIKVNDPHLRTRLLRRAELKSLSTRQLAQEIKREQPATSNGQRLARLSPKKGPLNIYQSIKSPSLLLNNDELLLDAGFNVWKKVRKSEMKASHIVLRRDKMSFTYKAYVQEVVDGDTLWAVVDLGLGSYTSQKLRLRGIDAPELKTPAGKKAKAFVQKALKGLDYIIICSSKSDKYDRYLADIYYGKDERFLNQELLDAGLAKGYRE